MRLTWQMIHQVVEELANLGYPHLDQNFTQGWVKDQIQHHLDMNK